MTFKHLLFTLLWVGCFNLSIATAVTLTMDGGKLTGASTVNVNGVFYNVEFVDGSCVSLFSGV
ncbi:MAG: hypothetical protein NPIRA02_28290 [Nitrospirales bacterium]|nr:MAG: hypothetical protein NPIRA02_28290 [Nitrospirales bacterium]